MLSDIWKVYNDGDFRNAFRLAMQGICDNAGIDLLHIAGLSLMDMRRCDEGLTLLKAASTMRPASPHIHINAAYMAERINLKHEAEYFAEVGLKDFPDNPDLLLLKANSLVMQMRFDEAIPVYEHLLERDPKHVQSMINLGNIARAKDDFAQAMEWFAEAEALEPDSRDLIFARATMHTQRGEDVKAIEFLEPISDDVDAQFLLALLYLARGEYERGFRLYRSRSNAIWYKTGNFVYPLNPFDHWTEVNGKRIAIVQEGGFGDMLQFVRYIPAIAAIAEVTLFTPPSLYRLFRHSLPGNVKISDTYQTEDATRRCGYDPSAYDYVTTDVEMPYHFRTSFETVPNDIPYLYVADEVIEARRLPPTSRLRVGLCWAGGKQDELNQRSYDSRRSFDLDTYAPLSAVRGIEFVSLQVGQRSEQTCDALPMLRPLDDSCDFMDTAAIISQLDLVISVDTAVAHLAAAIGKPVWLLSRYDCCWRWTKNRRESVWYPNLRVFGQTAYRDWTQPIAQVVVALAGFGHE